MKKLALVVFALALSLGSFAQPKEGKREAASPEEHAERMTERMVEKLELNDTQKEKVHEANLILAKEIKASQEERKAAMKKHDEALKAALTEEQYEAYVKTRKARLGKHRHNR